MMIYGLSGCWLLFIITTCTSSMIDDDIGRLIYPECHQQHDLTSLLGTNNYFLFAFTSICSCTGTTCRRHFYYYTAKSITTLNRLIHQHQHPSDRMSFVDNEQFHLFYMSESNQLLMIRLISSTNISYKLLPIVPANQLNLSCTLVDIDQSSVDNAMPLQGRDQLFVGVVDNRHNNQYLATIATNAQNRLVWGDDIYESDNFLPYDVDRFESADPITNRLYYRSATNRSAIYSIQLDRIGKQPPIRVDVTLRSAPSTISVYSDRILMTTPMLNQVKLELIKLVGGERYCIGMLHDSNLRVHLVIDTTDTWNLSQLTSDQIVHQYLISLQSNDSDIDNDTSIMIDDLKFNQSTIIDNIGQFISTHILHNPPTPISLLFVFCLLLSTIVAILLIIVCVLLVILCIQLKDDGTTSSNYDDEQEMSLMMGGTTMV